jgi:hypothetical protein
MDRLTARRQREATRAADARAVDQQHDSADALYRERGPSDRMRMPHERDESATAATSAAKTPEQEAVIGQAAEDLERGLRDTDCRAQPPGAGSACPQITRGSRPPARGRSTSASPPARLGRAGRRMRRAGA